MVISHTAIVAAGRGWVMRRGEGASRLCRRRRRRGSRSRAIVVRRRYGGGATREEMEVEVEREWWFVLVAAGEVVINTASLSFLARNAASLGRQRGDALYTCVQTNLDASVLSCQMNHQDLLLVLQIWATQGSRDSNVRHLAARYQIK